MGRNQNNKPKYHLSLEQRIVGADIVSKHTKCKLQKVF